MTEVKVTQEETLENDGCLVRVFIYSKDYSQVPCMFSAILSGNNNDFVDRLKNSVAIFSYSPKALRAPIEDRAKKQYKTLIENIGALILLERQTR